jgi:DsbC/DsbD-like thiol-disulfide interchange protein
MALISIPAPLPAGTAAKPPPKPASVKAEKHPVTFTATPARITSAPGKKFTLTFTVMIAKGWHINSHTPYQEYLVPTSITVTSAQPLTVAVMTYPAGSDFEFAGETLSVFEGTIKLKADITIPKKTKPGKCDLTIKLRFQACDGKSCLAPEEVAAKVPVTIMRSKGPSR